jgi:sulfite exporter TauE/SafE
MLPVQHNNIYKKSFQTALYHLGRLTSYALLGLIFGLVGRGLYLFGFQQKLSIVIGAIMILSVVVPSRLFKTQKFFSPFYKIFGKLKSSLGKELKKKSPDTFLLLGLLNGFLPCGLVYMAVLGAIATSNALQGSMFMALFGLGTVPLMTGVVFLGALNKGKIRQYFQKAIPILMVVIGIFFILRGMGLGIPYVSPSEPRLVLSEGVTECQTQP